MIGEVADSQFDCVRVLWYFDWSLIGLIVGLKDRSGKFLPVHVYPRDATTQNLIRDERLR
jgi:hypothetical protein